MLLEIDNAELVHMLEDQTSLKGKVGLHIYFNAYFQYYTMQCCGSGIRDWVLFDPWIRDPE
jgi:hypothetical protein